MTHWSEFLAFAVCHTEAMAFTQIQIDPGQMIAAMQAAQQQAQRVNGLLGGGFDPRLIKTH